MCTARRENRIGPARSARMASSVTESTPPERPTTRCAPGCTTGCSAAATPSARLLDIEFLELAIAHQTLEAFLDKHGWPLVEERPHRILQGFFEVLRRPGVVAVRPAERLVDDFVHQPQRL